jgi:hypothetical protein
LHETGNFSANSWSEFKLIEDRGDQDGIEYGHWVKKGKDEKPRATNASERWIIQRIRDRIKENRTSDRAAPLS